MTILEFLTGVVVTVGAAAYFAPSNCPIKNFRPCISTSDELIKLQSDVKCLQSDVARLKRICRPSRATSSDCVNSDCDCDPCDCDPCDCSVGTMD